MNHLFRNLGFQKKKHTQENQLPSPRQRYDDTLENFFQTGTVWCLLDQDGDTVTLDLSNQIFICIWPDRASAIRFGELAPAEISNPYEVSREELLHQAKILSEDPVYQFAVYPTAQDFWVLSPEELLCAFDVSQLELIPEQERHYDDGCKE